MAADDALGAAADAAADQVPEQMKCFVGLLQEEGDGSGHGKARQGMAGGAGQKQGSAETGQDGAGQGREEASQGACRAGQGRSKSEHLQSRVRQGKSWAE